MMTDALFWWTGLVWWLLVAAAAALLLVKVLRHLCEATVFTRRFMRHITRRVTWRDWLGCWWDNVLYPCELVRLPRGGVVYWPGRERPAPAEEVPE